MYYKRIKDLREDLDLTQQAVADNINCGRRAYSHYECGDVDVPVEILVSLAAYYGTSLDYLVGLTDEKKPYARREKRE